MKRTEYIFLAFVILIAIIVRLSTIGDGLTNKIILTNTLDFSWQSDIIERLLHGQIAGRDFIITYGPLYQLLTSIPAFVFSLPSYLSLLYSHILLDIINVFSLFFIAKNLTKDRKDNLFLFTLLLFVVGLISFPDPNVLTRILLPMIFGLVYYKFIWRKKSKIIILLFVLSLPTLLGLYTYDLFVVGLLIVCGFLLYDLYVILNIKTNKKKLFTLLRKSALQFGIIFLSQILISIILNNNFEYLIYSYDTVKNYQFIMNIPLSINSHFPLFIFPTLLLILLYILVRKTTMPDENKILLVTLSLIAILEIKSAFIRMDEGHIVMGTYPSIILSFICLYLFVRNRGISAIALTTFIIFYLFIPYRENIFTKLSFHNINTSLIAINKHPSFFEVYTFPKEYYFKNQDFTYFESLISRNPGNVMVYPYENFILNIYKQTFNTYPLQFYEYSNSPTEENAVRNLKNTPPKYIILGVDDKTAQSLDDIPNLTRNPILAKWMLGNYIVHKKINNYLILRFDPDKKSKLPEYNKLCSVYDIEVSNIMNGNIIDTLGKPSTFYLQNVKTIRLPYRPGTKEIFIISDYDNPNMLEKIFNSRINFTKYSKHNNANMKIINKYVIPKIKTTYNGPFSLKCY